MGNEFLGQIREVDAIAHVLRCFEDSNVTHVEGSIDPIRDAETVETELLIADLYSMEKRVAAAQKKARGGDKEAKAMLEVAEPALELLRDGKPARRLKLSAEQKPVFKACSSCRQNPSLYVCNVEEASAATGNEQSLRVADYAQARGAASVVISAAIEAEVSALADDAEKRDFLGALGLKEAGLTRVIHAGYRLLDLVTFFTVGPKEAHAWTVANGAKAPQAAGVIHTDFEKGFIRAETIAFADFVACGGETGAKEAGKMRLEGAEYLVQDCDIFHFRFQPVRTNKLVSRDRPTSYDRATRPTSSKNQPRTRPGALSTWMVPP